MVINPELESAREMAKILYMPSTLEVTSFAHGQAELIKFQIPEGNMLDNLPISELGKNLASDVLIGAVERGDEVETRCPLWHPERLQEPFSQAWGLRQSMFQTL